MSESPVGDRLLRRKIENQTGPPSPPSLEKRPSWEELEVSWANINRHQPYTRSLADYCRKNGLRPHDIPMEQVVPTTITIERAEIVSFIKAFPLEALRGKGVWIGINNNGLRPTGERISEAPLFVSLDEAAWTRTLGTFSAIGLTCSALKADGNFATEVADIHDKELVTVRYWGLEVDDNKQGDGTGDPRAQLIPEVLTDTTWPWPYVYTYAQIQLAGVDRRELDEVREVRDASPMKRRPSPERKGPMFQGMTKGFLKTPPVLLHEPHEEHDAHASQRSPTPVSDVSSEVQWSDPINLNSSEEVFRLREEANKLQARADSCSQLGDQKSAYAYAAEAIELVCRAEAAENRACQSEAPSPSEAPTAAFGPEPEPEPKKFLPAVEYVYPDGTVRTIEAGRYTASEHMARSLEEQDLWSAAMTAITDLAEKAKDTSGLGKYESPLTRTPSQAESITNAEALKDMIAHKAARARNVMGALLSKEASPTLAAAPAPELPASSEMVNLGQSMAKFRMVDEMIDAKTPDADHRPEPQDFWKQIPKAPAPAPEID